jgi:dienelactone hydrolase
MTKPRLPRGATVRPRKATPSREAAQMAGTHKSSPSAEKGRWSTLAWGMALSAVVCLAGCTSASATPARPAAPAAGDRVVTCPPAGGRVVICAAPVASLADQPVTIKVSGLRPRALVSVRVRSADAHGMAWSSSAVFRASRAGSINAARSAALSGSYTGVSAMGLFWSMQPRGRFPDGAYSWKNITASSFTVSVAASGRVLASASLSRGPSATAITAERETVARAGFYGEFFSPAVPGRRPAVLVLGGSDGGLSLGGPSTTLLAAMLAAHGYPALALAYFRAPGLPPALADIPLEYFAKALRWLRGQPHVDPGRVLALGISRGSEAALLVGAHYPGLVGGVIASVPNHVAGGQSWTLHGQPLPPGEVIPVERIKGPVFLDCAGADHVLTSCPNAHAILRRLAAHHDPYRHVLYAYPAAGHGVGTLMPYEPVADTTSLQQFTQQQLAGTSADANPDAQAELWPRLLQFLTDLTPAR